jgi:cytochrome P450 family 110
MTLPRGPDTHPALQIVQWIHDPMRFLERNSARYGAVFTARFAGLGPIVMIGDPAGVREVFALGPDEAHAGKANVVLKPFLGEHSLLLLDGAKHVRQRKMMLPAFHGERMQAYGRTMIDLTHASIDGWPVGEPFAMHKRTQWITLEVILRTVFGIEEGPKLTELAQLLTRGLEIVKFPAFLFEIFQKDLGPLSPWGRFRRIGDRVSEILLGEIRRGREKGTRGRTDVLAMMLDARDEAGHELTELEIHDELITLLLAGHETTATSIAWALRHLLPDHGLWRRLEEEVATAGGDPARIAKLEFLDGCVKEALRLQPVIPLVGRILQQPMRIAGYELPADVAVAPAIYLVHMRESLYPSPKSFWPDRYVTFKPSPSEWIPFGGGLRRCLGAAFAVYEMKMVLATVAQRVNLALASPRIRVVRRGITLTPSEGMPVRVTAKRPRAEAAAA